MASDHLLQILHCLPLRHVSAVLIPLPLLLGSQIHKTMIKTFKYALVWGQSVRHRPQRVGKDHILMDEDIVQIIKRI